MEMKMKKTKWLGSWKKITFIILATVIFCTCTLSWDVITYDWTDWIGEPKDQLLCFDYPHNMLPELDENEPKLGSGIFFHETSCPKDVSDIKLNARQSCSIESALRAHPDRDVFLLISTPVLRPLEETENVLIQELLTYRNFKLRHITFSKYLSNTPLYRIYKSGALNSSLWPVQHSSDVLRYTTLYKFGGVYLDLDVIVLKPLDKLKNFAGAESDTSLGSGILGFSYDKIGRDVATHCAKELARTYNGGLWGFNGPGVITRVMEKRCETNSVPEMTKSYCNGFQIYPSTYFSAISYNEPHLFFEAGTTDKVRKMLTQSFTIHYWNKLTSMYNNLDNKLDIPYLKYAERYCPKIYTITEGNFNNK